MTPGKLVRTGCMQLNGITEEMLKDFADEMGINPEKKNLKHVNANIYWIPVEKVIDDLPEYIK